MILALVIALGIMLGKVKVAGVSLGVTGILFVGIAFSYFGMNIDEHLMHFLKEFGLILFVYSIGLQVGPGFFSSFRKGGITLNKLAVLVVALGVVTTVALYYVTGLPMTTMVGVMSGAVTNTPGLGAAQQAFSDLHAGADAPDIATGYALAYPLGVIGAILTLLALRYLLRIDVRQEEEAAGLGTDVLKDLTTGGFPSKSAILPSRVKASPEYAVWPCAISSCRGFAVRAKLLNWPMLRRRSAAATGFCSWRRPKMPRHWSRCSAGRWMPVR